VHNFAAEYSQQEFSFGRGGSYLIGKLKKCRLNEWTVRWIENWLNVRAQRVVVSSAV